MGVCFLTENSEFNLIGLDFIEQLILFEIILKSVFNTLNHMSFSDVEKLFTNKFKNKFGNVFQEFLCRCTKSKAILKSKEDS